MRLSALAVASCVAAVWGNVPGDLVTNVPGLQGELPTRHWSGYIEADLPEGGQAFFHYYLVENSAKDPKAPTLMWNNGGPGSSSLMGLFTENGPLTLNDDSFNTEEYAKTGVPTVFLNPNSWHTIPANVIYVEHPAPTGFSYCTSNCTWTDSTQATANYNFMVNFFKAYPELAQNDFYMVGESYAGVLIPTAALEILKHRTDANKNTAPWSLSGFALGNDCPGNLVETCTPYSGWIGTKTAVDFRYGHGMIKDATYKRINEACEGHWGTFKAPPEPCRSLLGDPIRPVMWEAGDTYEMGGGYFLYDNCQPDLMALSGEGVAEAPSREKAEERRKLRAAYDLNSGEYACGQERGANVWLNLQEVQTALHVKLVGKTSFDFSTALVYNHSEASLVDTYGETLIKNFRILQYSGDADPCVPYVGTQRWIDSLNLTIAVDWHPWTAPNTIPVTGYVTTYALNNFTFATIRGAGHMAPRYKPRESLYMITNYIANKPL
eukprot:TRINITY_DN19136_c0_g1_i1.p1 TRINITY_DN19136_c0_g1~~TRINITY_DN19136_c0_g1_i1.p1  ORF type:complete len:508 (+),score=88.37 TRINITY_DN19136_c0_g1_i1:48-1526(+)